MDDDEDRATDHGEERHEQGSYADRQGHQSPPRFFAALSAHDSVRRFGMSPFGTGKQTTAPIVLRGGNSSQ
jgi:hypothetical protein